jgi:hypothetical protein
MQITGVQSVGARSLGSVSATVSDTGQDARAASVVAEREGPSGSPRPLTPEAVVFPHDGKPVDHRPVRLRHQRAAARFREDGRG